MKSSLCDTASAGRAHTPTRSRPYTPRVELDPLDDLGLLDSDEGQPAPSLALPPMLPFAGRNAELASLCGWLRDGQAASGQKRDGAQDRALVCQPVLLYPDSTPGTLRLDGQSPRMPRLVVLEGVLGAGKTRLVTEVATLASRAGYTVTWGAGQPEEARTPYFIWHDALTPLLRALPTDQRASMARGASSHANWPERILSGLTTLSQPLESHMLRLPARLRSWRAVVDLLRVSASAIGPLLIVLENLHWADAASLRLLGYVLHHADTRDPRPVSTGPARGRMSEESGGDRQPFPLILATRRVGPAPSRSALATSLTSLRRARLMTQLRLGPLGATDVSRIVREVLGTAGTEAVVDQLASQVYAISAGNPLFIAGALHTAGRGASRTSLSIADPSVTLPDVVATELDQLLTAVSPACREWLAAVATCGATFTFAEGEQVWEALWGWAATSHRTDEYAPASGIPPAERFLAEALAAGLIQGEQSTGSDDSRTAEALTERYQFWHPLFASHLAATLTPPRRARVQSALTHAHALATRAGGSMSVSMPSTSTVSRDTTFERLLDTLPNASAGHEIAAGAVGLERLSEREREVLALIATGQGTREIAEALCLSVATVRTHIRNLLGKLEVPSRLHAALLWRATRMIPIPTNATTGSDQ